MENASAGCSSLWPMRGVRCMFSSVFRGAPPSEDELDDAKEKENGTEIAPNTGGVSRSCTQCNYTICEQCALPENQGSYIPQPNLNLLDGSLQSIRRRYPLGSLSVLQGHVAAQRPTSARVTV